MKNKTIIVFLGFAIFLSSCSQVLRSSSPETTGTSISVQQTAKPTMPTLPPTAGAISTMFAMSSPVPIATITPKTGWSTRCLADTPQLSAELRGGGSLILNEQGSGKSFSLDMVIGARNPLRDDWQWGDWTVSPNENWLAHSRADISQSGKLTNVELQVIDFQGKLLATVPLDDVYGGWLNNELLYFHHPIKPSDDAAFSFVVRNPFTGKRQEFLPNYLGIYPDRNYYDKVNYSPIEVYDPDLEFVVYPYLSGDQTEQGWRLWDIANQRIVANIPALVQFSGPIWSADGQRFVVIGLTSFSSEGYAELFEVSRDGQVTQLTNIGAFGGYISNNSYSWSPDSRHIAFWMHTNQNQEDDTEQLAVLNVNSHEVVNYCISGRKPVGAEVPIWSPDSQQLAVASYDKDSNIHLIVVDIKQETAFLIGENVIPAFWLKTVPPVWLKTQ